MDDGLDVLEDQEERIGHAHRCGDADDEGRNEPGVLGVVQVLLHMPQWYTPPSLPARKRRLPPPFPASKRESGALAAKANEQADGGDGGVEQIILHVHGNETQYGVTLHKANHGDHGIHQAKEHQVRAGHVVARVHAVERNQTTEQVDDVMDRINLKDEERTAGEKTGDADDHKHETEEGNQGLHERVHRGGSRVKMSLP